MQKNLIKVIFFVLLCCAAILPQEVDIVVYLRQIESGKIDDARKGLVQLEEKSPGDPSVKFLKGVLAENAQESVDIYSDIVKNYPRSKYADASLYRLYSYYYALGSYETAKSHLTRLKKSYPQSPYIKIAERDIPSKDDNVVVTTEAPVVEKKENTGPKNYKYTIQAGAFSLAANALSLKKDLEKSGFETDIKEKSVAGTTFQIVYIGKFESEEEAKNFLQVINSEFNLEGRVVSLN